MIIVRNLKKSFINKNSVINAIDDVSFEVEKGDVFGIIGFSGAGKSTLIRCLNLLEVYDEGEVIIDGRELKSLTKRELLKERESIGMIFQHFNLLQSSTVYENIASPLKNTKGYTREQIKNRVRELLKLVDLEDKENSYPSQLSGGQKQRVAIARALSRDCKLLLCDEATSALDPNTTKSILQLLKKINRELNVTIVLITHQMEVVKTICNRVAIMEKGKFVESGDLIEIFSNPKHPTTGDFVLESSYSSELSDILKDHTNKIYSISFVGDIVDEPILANTQREFNVDINILFGNIELLSGRKVGNVIVEILGENSKDAIKKLEEKGLKVREVEC